MTTDPRHCKACGAALSRHGRESPAQFAGRANCNRACSIKTKKHGAKFKDCGHDPSERAQSPNGHRYCRPCKRAYARAYDAAARLKVRSGFTPENRCNRCKQRVDGGPRAMFEHKKRHSGPINTWAPFWVSQLGAV